MAETLAEAVGASNAGAVEPGYVGSLRRAIRDPERLLAAVGLDRGAAGAGRLAAARAAAGSFRLLVPESYVARMAYGDSDDPLLRQVLPLGAENDVSEGFTADPVGDADAKMARGLIKKYDGRSLLITTGACAVHCRYCFRRHFPYADEGGRDWQPAVEAVAADRTITEVILSGGDPLMLRDGPLASLIARLDAIPHVRRLRVHTRLPVVLPDRVTDRLTGMLLGTRARSVVVVHANHPREIAADCAEALVAMTTAGLSVLNQAVLLRGVNDSVVALSDLSERLFDVGVLPYYLHQLDRVAGAAHFEVPEAEGVRLIEELRSRLPGYLVPRYVRETAGERSKSPIEASARKS